MVKAGAVEEKDPKESLYLLRIEDGTSSRAWSVYRDWVNKLDDADPNVISGFAPSMDIANSVLVPNLALVGPLLREVSSIMVHMSLFTIQAFGAGLPPISPPLPAVPMVVQFHHAKVATTALVKQLQSPPANYPLLSSLHPGSYICHLFYQWTSAAVNVAVFKS